jgi:hypothetical protein
MTTDDSMMYPQDGSSYADTTYSPGLPRERVEEESKANAVLAASYPIMAAVADWFHEQAQNAPDIANIDLSSNVPVEAQVLALQMYQSKMIEKAKEFEAYRSEYNG